MATNWTELLVLCEPQTLHCYVLDGNDSPGSHVLQQWSQLVALVLEVMKDLWEVEPLLEEVRPWGWWNVKVIVQACSPFSLFPGLLESEERFCIVYPNMMDGGSL